MIPGLLKTIFYILVFYYGFKFLARIFAPVIIKKAADSIQKKAEEQFRNQQPKNTVKEGETIIDKKPNSNQQGKNSVGEYVDFEEIE
ncbi:MAG: DUF4834 family protein [Polaribacter sp.]